jgi:hypothetical protein
MAKRARSDSLTGGTKDVNPQFMSGKVTCSAANTFTEVQIALPVARPITGGTQKTTIVEILKIFADFANLDLDAAAATQRSQQFAVTTTTQGSSIFTLDNPRCIMILDHTVRNAFTAAGSAALDIKNMPLMADLTDGAGHGVLVGTDSIFLGFDTNGFTAAVSVFWKILYRFKDVSLVEYIGIVQSQQ